MRTAKELSELFGALDPNESVWCAFITKDDDEENFSNFGIEDEQGNLVDVKPFVTSDTVERIADSLDNDDYLWERFNENFRDTCSEVLNELIEEKNKAEEDTDLWDKEQASVTSKDD